MDYCIKSMLEAMSAFKAAAAKGTEKRTAVDKLIEKLQISKPRYCSTSWAGAFVFTLGIDLGGMAWARQFHQVPQDPPGPCQFRGRSNV